MTQINSQVRENHRKVLVGIVTNNSNNKTIAVKVERKGKHLLYKKLVISHKKYQVHDETNDAKIGDRVEIIETRPLSATKRWRLVRVLERAK